MRTKWSKARLITVTGKVCTAQSTYTKCSRYVPRCGHPANQSAGYRAEPQEKRRPPHGKGKEVQRSDSFDEETNFGLAQSHQWAYGRPSVDQGDDRGEGPSRPYGVRPVDSEEDDDDLPSAGRLFFRGKSMCGCLWFSSRIDILFALEPTDPELEPSEPDTEG